MDQQAQLIADMQQKIAELTKKLENKVRGGSIKVSPKGGVSVYGMGRFPVTLYMSQWEALFTRQDEIKQFIVDHASELASKEKAAVLQ